MILTLSGYLDRIGYGGSVAPTAEVLQAVHRAHLLAIPYENLDIHLGRPLPLDPARFYRKLVDERRGGWCYEMNGLLGWALREIGFEVRLLGGTVGRAVRGDGVEGNHLVLGVLLDRLWIADTGFGDGLLDPVPLAEGPVRQMGFEFGFSRTGDRWTFHNQPAGGVPSFDFTMAPRRLAEFADRCHQLQTSPESGFVRSTVVQRWMVDGVIMSLRGAVLRRIEPANTVERVLTGRAELEWALESIFGLDPTGLGALWPGIERRHRQWEAEMAAARATGTSS